MKNNKAKFSNLNIQSLNKKKKTKENNKKCNN